MTVKIMTKAELESKTSQNPIFEALLRAAPHRWLIDGGYAQLKRG